MTSCRSFDLAAKLCCKSGPMFGRRLKASCNYTAARMLVLCVGIMFHRKSIRQVLRSKG